MEALLLHKSVKRMIHFRQLIASECDGVFKVPMNGFLHHILIALVLVRQHTSSVLTAHDRNPRQETISSQANAGCVCKLWKGSNWLTHENIKTKSIVTGVEQSRSSLDRL